MLELIVGTGRKRRLDEVIVTAEAEVRRMHGPPRGLILRGKGLEVHASRRGFDGPFEDFVVRIPSDGAVVKSIREFAEESAQELSIVEADDQLELRFREELRDTDDSSSDSVLSDLARLLHLPEVWRIRGEKFRHEPIHVESLFHAMQEFHASDLHLYPGSPPVFRINNRIRRADHAESLSADQIFTFIKDIAAERDWKRFQTHRQCSFTFHQAGLAYARVSAFVKTGVPHCTMRFLPERIPTFEDLRIPPASLQKLSELRYGLVLIAGMTGSGKSTTVASIVDWINTHRACHILSIEDPIEFVHSNRKAVVSQREVGRDVESFQEGVHGAMRHDPDVLFIGEMRDPDTIHSAIDAAATGHLVLSTFHANTASEVVGRIVSFFDSAERDLVRMRLGECLKCVLCQRLAPHKSAGRIPILELLYNDTQHLAEFIKEGDAHAIRVAMQQDVSESFIFETCLMKQVIAGDMEWDDALAYASNAEVLKQMRLGTYVVPSLEQELHGHGHGHRA